MSLSKVNYSISVTHKLTADPTRLAMQVSVRRDLGYYIRIVLRIRSA
jgi:hypothetical protein